jgi:Delta7-sterol 5-desaturase
VQVLRPNDVDSWTGGFDGLDGMAAMAGMVFETGEGNAPLIEGLIVFGLILARYVLVAGVSHLLLYRPGNAARSRGPNPTTATLRDFDPPRHRALGAFGRGVCPRLPRPAGGPSPRAHPPLHGCAEPRVSGMAYGLASYLLVLLLQDAWFYLTHRLVHQPALYGWMHSGHHRSHCPTPWTSFAFDPPEAALQALFLIVVVALIPLHPITLIAVLSTMTIWAVVNHLGLDRLPLAFPHHWLGRWLIGPSHHALHHKRPGVHFGLYFTHLDHLFGSEDPTYVRSLGTAISPATPHRR